jgi:hypothetical protein
MNHDFKDEQYETFVYDLEKLASLSFDSPEYDITQAAIVLRKFLLDNSGVVAISNSLQKEKVRFLSINLSQRLDQPYLDEVKMHLPVLSVLPIVSITNYTAIKLFNKDGSPKRTFDTRNSSVEARQASLATYLGEDYLVLDSEYLSRKDLIEYMCYGKGAVHFGVDDKKIQRLIRIKNLTFNYAMGSTSPDSILSWAVSFHTPELEKQYLDTPELSKFMMQLGDRHTFQALMQLQIIFEIVRSASVEKVYQLCKEYLVQHVPKFRMYDASSLFSIQSRKITPI